MYFHFLICWQFTDILSRIHLCILSIMSSSTYAIFILNEVRDWGLSADLKTYLQFPVDIIQTEKRPDIVAWSYCTELAVPWEENREEAHERKKTDTEHCVPTA